MLDYAVHRASAGFRLIFNSVLPSLPLPGTNQFAALCRGLQPFGLSADGINVSTQAIRLADFGLECSVMQGRVTLKITHGWMEANIPTFQESDTQLVPVLLEAATDAILGDWRNSLTAPVTRLTYGAHLSLPADQLRSFLTDHLPPKYEPLGLSPDAFAYNVATDGEHKELEKARVVFARSLLLDAGIYVEFVLEYGYSITAAKSIDRAQETIWRTLETFGFERSKQEGAKNV